MISPGSVLAALEAAEEIALARLDAFLDLYERFRAEVERGDRDVFAPNSQVTGWLVEAAAVLATIDDTITRLRSEDRCERSGSSET